MTGGFDASLLGIFHDLRSPGADGFFLAATWLGSLWLLLPPSIVAAIVQRRMLLPLALLLASGASHAIKLAVARNRPGLHETLVALPADLSFPSAHSAQAAAFAVAVALAFPAWRRWPALLVLTALVVLVGLSRLHLQVHWPSDVLAGWALGVLMALLAWRLTGQRPEAPR